MRRLLLLPVLLCLFNDAFAQKTMLDSLFTELDKHPQKDTNKVNILIAICSNVWGSDPKKTRDYAQEALSISQELDYRAGIADSYREMSRYFWTQTEYDKSTDYALNAIKEYERCNDLAGISWCYGTIGSNYSQANNYDKADHFHTLALELNKKIRNESGISRNLNSLGYICELKKNYSLALEYYKKALNIRTRLGDVTDITASYLNVGSIYYYLGDYTPALEYLSKALELARQVNNKNYIALIYQNIGEVYYKTGQYQEGERYLKNALAIGQEIGDKKRKEGVYEALVNLEESRQNYKAAFYYLNHLKNIRDTLYTQDRSRQMARMETLFETEKKEQTIKLLAQEHRIQTIWKNVLTAGIILGLIVSLIIYNLQRSRTRKAKELLTIQQSLNEKLTGIDKLKSRFFANISHEFRTPLTLILAPLEEKLADPGLGKDEKGRVLLMKRNANRLLDLVNQLLDLTKLEAGKMVLAVIHSDDLKGFLKMLSASFDSLADNKKINFIKDIDIPDQTYWFDPDVLEKILSNLLYNAFKFTPANGSVILTIQSEIDSSGKTNWLRIQVADTGKGIPVADQAEIFSPFYQAKNTMQDGQAGTGLGLSLVKELTKLYGGSLELVSEENQGTSITVHLPAGKENFTKEQQVGHEAYLSNPVATRSIEELEQFTTSEEDRATDIILIVEDNADLRNFLVSILQPRFSVITAVNGKEGMEKALFNIPCLIISDLMMPVMDGITLTEKIKSNECTSHIPVILLTAKNEHESKLEGLRTGADDYLTKPFSTEELRIRVANLIAQRKLLAERYRERFLMLPSPSAESSLDEKFLQKVKMIIEANVGDFSFGVEKLAGGVNVSRAQLVRKLKALTGLPPSELIKDLRLKKAAELIISKSDTITRIGYAVGFNDQSYFTKCFKKKFGVSPTDYMQSSTLENTNL